MIKYYSNKPKDGKEYSMDIFGKWYCTSKKDLTMTVEDEVEFENNRSNITGLAEQEIEEEYE